MKKSIIVGEIYRHFKGGIYRVIHVGRCADRDALPVVIYQSMTNADIWVRNLDDFVGTVTLENNNIVKRFEIYDE